MYLSGEIGYEITAKDIINHINNGVTEFILNTPGGSLLEGLACHDAILGRGITVGVLGTCFSAGTIILAAATERWASPNSRILIHNPYIGGGMFGGISGTAEEIKKQADELQIEQDRLVNIFTSLTGKTTEEINDLMKQNKLMSPQEALELKLITNIKTVEEMAETKLNAEQVKKLNLLNSVFNSMRNLFKPEIKNIIVADTNGVELDFTDAETADEIAVGKHANADGQPANGEYVMPSGEIYVFTNGELTEIKMPVEDKEKEQLAAENKKLTELVNSLNASIKDLTDAKTAIENKNKELSVKFGEIEKNFTDFKNQFSNGKTPENKTPETGGKIGFSIRKKQ